MNKDLMYTRIRNLCGFLGMILPWLAIFSVLLIQNRHTHSLYSISATYYNSPALASVLTSASIVLMTYDGYEKIDNYVTTISGVFGLGIVLFPCTVNWIDKMDRVGFFQIPMTYSNKIHCFCAAVFFLLLTFNCLFLFTKHDGEMTKQKKIRNVVYRVCGFGMLFFMLWQVVTSQVHFFKGWWTMINEIFLLQFFGISWLVKGGAIPFLNDKE